MTGERHQCNGDEMAALPRRERRFLVGQQFGLADKGDVYNGLRLLLIEQNIDLTASSATFSRRAKMSAATWRWRDDVRPRLIAGCTDVARLVERVLPL